VNLQQMRDLVRTQLDLDDTDLPNVLLDAFIQQGYDLVLGLENQWPFFQESWPLAADVDGTIPIPPGLGHIELLLDSTGRLLPRVDARWAFTTVGPTTQGNPSYWSQFVGSIRVYPAPNATANFQALGYRIGSDWIAAAGAGGAGAECDCDRRLHIPICWYACSLGYAQQEDEVLERTYLDRYHETADEARKAIMRTWPGQPLQASYTHYAHGSVGVPQVLFSAPGP
jgi:hypothetical protein